MKHGQPGQPFLVNLNGWWGSHSQKVPTVGFFGWKLQQLWLTNASVFTGIPCNAHWNINMVETAKTLISQKAVGSFSMNSEHECSMIINIFNELIISKFSMNMVWFIVKTTKKIPGFSRKPSSITRTPRFVRQQSYSNKRPGEAIGRGQRGTGRCQAPRNREMALNLSKMGSPPTQI